MTSGPACGRSCTAERLPCHLDWTCTPLGGLGDVGIQTAFDQVVQAFAQGAPQGLAVQEVACGETVYDGQAKRMKRPAQVVCQAYLYAAAQPGGLFTDFELRGGIKP